MINIAAIVGDFYHPAEYGKEALNQALAPMADRMQWTFYDREHAAEALAGRPDAIVLFAEDRFRPEGDASLRWMHGNIERTVLAYVESGGGLFAWHSGLAGYLPESAFVSMLKGYFLSHPHDHQPVKYVPANGDAPYALVDEHYFVACDEARTNVFLRSESVDGSSIAGWRHGFGEGRVCCATPAHRREGLLHPDVLGLVRRSVSWCAGADSCE